MQRYRPPRAALNAAIRAKKISLMRPATSNCLPGNRPKALLWTDERIRRWSDTGQKPSRVMVWTPHRPGISSTTPPTTRSTLAVPPHRLPRTTPRGSLRPTLERNRPHPPKHHHHRANHPESAGPPIRRTQIRRLRPRCYPATTPPMSSGAHRTRQHRVRRALGNAWVDSGLVFTDTVGSPLHPATVSTRFRELTLTLDFHPSDCTTCATALHTRPRRPAPTSRSSKTSSVTPPSPSPPTPTPTPLPELARDPPKPPPASCPWRTARNTGARIEPGAAHRDRRHSVRRREPAGKHHRGPDSWHTRTKRRRGLKVLCSAS